MYPVCTDLVKACARRYAAQTMYTIKQAAARSGLSVSTVRAWERRYGVVHPERTATGYRLYDEGAIDRLLAMRHLVEVAGMRPSQAAEQLRGAELGDVLDRARRWRDSTPPAPTTSASATRGSDLTESFVEAARLLRVAAMEDILDDAFASQRFEAAVEDVVFPALRAVGDAWAAGTIDVAMEHAASETVRRRLAWFYGAIETSGDPDLVVGMPPGGQHDIGALAFAVAARRQHLAVLYLGADVPLASWLSAADTSRARVAVIGVVNSTDVRAARDVTRALRASARPPTVALGGPRAHQLDGDLGAVVLPDRIDEAVVAVRDRLKSPR